MIGGLVDILIPPALSPVGNDVPEQIYDLEPARRLDKQYSAPKAAPVALVPVFPMKQRHEDQPEYQRDDQENARRREPTAGCANAEDDKHAADARQERKPLQIEPLSSEPLVTSHDCHP